ncbi:MAG: hypothetical protein KDK41_08250 [Leptospiraceae bacterium]|nr:hypothetical protein [Leptospiraceae bacterium]MCB1200623.1 hypothetical protein [Leptospiraceae bacterium]
MPTHSLQAAWNKYRLIVKADLPIPTNINPHQRQELRRDVLDKVWERMSPDFENLILDANLTIRDLLSTNRNFASAYSKFFQNLSVGSIRIGRGELSTQIVIPLRGQDSLLEIIPFAWGTERYLKLTKEEYVGDFYETRTASGEYPESLAPVKYTGLIIDARGIKFNPSLGPRIYSPEGRLLYGPEFVSKNAGVTRAVAGFSENLTDRETQLRAGRMPLLAVAMSAFGENNTDVVISEADARRLFDHEDSIRSLLGCRVVFLYEPGLAEKNSLR